jgi:hypothetical protein
MTILSDLVLIESKSARDDQLERLSHDSAQSILNKVKSLYFAVWKGIGTATTEQLASFYEVPEVNIRQLIKPHQKEFESDGLKVARSKELKDASNPFLLAIKTTQLTIWTPRAALRLGMVLKNSKIAKAVRTSLLDAVEQVIPAQAHEMERLKLELELARATDSAARSQERLLAVSSALVSLHGSGMVALILGKPDAVVDRVTEVEKILLCNERGQPIKTYRGLSKTKLAKRYGMKGRFVRCEKGLPINSGGCARGTP